MRRAPSRWPRHPPSCPDRCGQATAPDPASPGAALAAEIAGRIAAGLDPAAVAARVLKAIAEDELYVFAHPEMRDGVAQRFAAILAALDKAAKG